jgi:hypothetical protein
MTCFCEIELTFNAAFASGPKIVPATVPITCLTSDIPCMTCPTALVTGALPTAAMALTDCWPKKLMAGLLQEQDPLMHEVDCMALELGTVGHEQSLAFLHALGLGDNVRQGSVVKEEWVLHFSAWGIVRLFSLLLNAFAVIQLHCGRGLGSALASRSFGG